jgi:GTP-binding protein
MGQKVEFIKSVVNLKDLPKEDYKEIVFVGRSNVGKSSLLNYLVGRNIARVGKTPGRTRAINFFLWNIENKKLFLVDLPGYGFARGKKDEVEYWKKLIEGYFRKNRKKIGLVFLLVDSKVGPTELDYQMINWLSSLGLPYVVLLTKIDKANQKELNNTLKKLQEVGVVYVIKTSAKDRKGKEEIFKVLKDFHLL